MIEDQDLASLCKTLVSKSYVTQGVQELHACRKEVKDILSQRCLPKQGWSEPMIERLLSDLAYMDSNNFRGSAGVGEREGRIACPLVARRNYQLAHGIGRSGDIAAEQPKAAGSSVLTRVTHFLLRHALLLAGLQEVAAVQVYPVATGMAMTLAFLSAAADRPQARNVLWSRIDQKTCLKSIVAANLTPVVIPLAQRGDQLETDTAALQQQVQQLGAEAIACVVTTTSCFAPRACDDVEAVARMCQEHSIPHVINNAYGVQSAALCRLVTRACRMGRVDIIIQSTDKNFMVPVGGAVTAAPKGREGGLFRAMAERYPGRAGVAAHLDLLATLLHLGQAGWLQMLQHREDLFTYFQSRLAEVAEDFGERLLQSPGNPISMALTVNSVSERLQMRRQLQQRKAAAGAQTADTEQSQDRRSDLESSTGAADAVKVAHKASSAVADATSATVLGAMLWQRHVSGVRVICRGKKQSVGGIQFSAYGSSTDAYPHDYMTAACALGQTKADVDVFVSKLRTVWAVLD